MTFGRRSFSRKAQAAADDVPHVLTSAERADWATWIDEFEVDEAAAMWHLITDQRLLTIAARICETDISPTLLAQVRGIRKSSTLSAIRQQAEQVIGGRINYYRTPAWAREAAQDDPSVVAAGGYLVLRVVLPNQTAWAFVSLNRSDEVEPQMIVERWECYVMDEEVVWEAVDVAE